MDVEQLGVSAAVSMRMLLAHYGLQDTEENRMRIIKNVLNEFANKYMWDVPYLKW